MTAESTARDSIAQLGRSLFARRLTFGRTGNISIRLGANILITPSGRSLGDIEPTEMSTITLAGKHVSGPSPSKESFLHAAMYASRPADTAIVHLHSTHSVAVSCLADIDPRDVLPPLTAYYVMRVGRLPLLPYHAPGDPALGPLAQAAAVDNHALLLANHGPIVSATELAAAADAIEELEETAHLYLILAGRAVRHLSALQVMDLES